MGEKTPAEGQAQGEAMTLREKQSKFADMVSVLLRFAIVRGYEITFGDAYATDGHSRNSKHYRRLAIDLNLFKDGVYLTETEDHKELGKFWEGIGGVWGGNFKYPDGNHYEL